jgi:HD superfamily phosphodiesterase
MSQLSYKSNQSHAPVWRAALPYMRARKNDIHVPISYRFAERLVDAHPAANRDVVLLAILLHDTGWAEMDSAEIIAKAFGPNMKEVMQSDVRRQHEIIGARIAGEILSSLHYPEALIDEVVLLIDGHDSRAHALSLNDQLLKDADKLWRFTTVGIAIACDWHKKNPTQYVEYLDRDVYPSLFTATARELATEALGNARAELLLELLR